MDLEKLKEVITYQKILLKVNTVLLNQYDVLELIERCEKAESRLSELQSSSVVTDNTKTLAAALERIAELDTELNELKKYNATLLDIVNESIERVAEMEKQEPYAYRVVNCDGVEYVHKLVDVGAYMIRHPYFSISPLYALPVPQQSDNPSELEMHRADHQACKAAGFESVGELLACYKNLIKNFK